MSFASQIEEIFGVDIWELKPQYKTSQQNQTTNDVQQQNEIITADLNDLELIYTNEITSSKIINILISTKLNLTFLKILLIVYFLIQKLVFINQMILVLLKNLEVLISMKKICLLTILTY